MRMIPQLEKWPRLDPITNRIICEKCWNGQHRKKNALDQLVDACDHVDCDCVHLSEANWAAIERKQIRDARKTRRKLEQDALEDTNNPLRAENPNFQKKYSGRDHA